ncbi:hypothetical protein GCM10020369_44170 [Cryptosporangium minutisporangium]|uniref:Heavy metal translocating P-type ATPase n=1 Tax=Cryptosporangium minutisporangium TaxID=113569 RepID=A0ABP6T1U5_9ACTN
MRFEQSSHDSSPTSGTPSAPTLPANPPGAEHHAHDSGEHTGRATGSRTGHGGHADHAGPGAHAAHDGHGAHGGHSGHDKHAGHDPEMFRRKFWLSLALTVPIVLTSHMIMDWFGYRLDFPGMDWVGPVLGTVVFFYGGWPFLVGGAREVLDRAPGMMLLISMAITVAYTASLATSLDLFDLDFWWELAALVTIMLLGHWQEMKAIGQAQGALTALAALLPDDAERLDEHGRPSARLRVRSQRWPRSCPTTPNASTNTAPRSGWRWPTCASATWCWCVPAAGFPPTDGSPRAARSSTSR